LHSTCLPSRQPARCRRPALRTCIALTAVAVLAAASGCGRSEQPPLLLLVTIDTLRADHLGAWGDTHGLTPNIDALAAQSQRFEAAFAPASYTLPSMAALHTGRYPEELGILANQNLFRGSSVTLAEILRLAGWRTGAVVSNYVLRRGTGMEQGFDFYDDTFTQEEANRHQPERTAGHTTDAALEMADRLRADAAAGIFLWVHFQDPHGPYMPPAGLRKRFAAVAEDAGDADRMLPSRGINAIAAIPSYQLIDGHHDVGFYRAGYAGEVFFADREFGRLLDGLDERDLLDDATIVFTADHGESLGEDDYWFAHGEFLSDVLVRVPLLVRAPGLAAGQRKDIVSLVDLVPSLVRRAGAEAPPGAPGRDLFAPDAEARGGHAYLATLMGSATRRYGWAEDGHVLVRVPLADGRASEQLRPLYPDSSGDDAPLRERLRERLRAFRRQLSVPPAVEQTLSPHDREMLRRLGYLE